MNYLIKYVINKKYIIQIPKTVYIKRIQNKFIIKGPLGYKYLKLTNQILLNKKNTKLIVLPYSFKKTIKTSSISHLKISQATLCSLIKKNILGVIRNYRKQLNFVGIGFRATVIKKTNLILYLRLGYNHPIYIIIPKNLQIVAPKPTKLFIFGNCYNTVSNMASLIRSYRKPEPYKGKGILYKNEILKRKEGKKA